MPPYRTLLFDLDGTLADTEEGVWIAVNAGLSAAGLPPVSRSLARTFIGPPLEDTFHTLGVTDNTFQAAWDGYAAAYKAEGMQRTKPVPGMPEAVHRLNEIGYTLAIASCKPWEYCVPIAALCGYGDCFSVISGSFHNGVPEHKPSIIREAMRLLHADPQSTLIPGLGRRWRRGMRSPLSGRGLLRLRGARRDGGRRRSQSGVHSGGIAPLSGYRLSPAPKHTAEK